MNPPTRYLVKLFYLNHGTSVPDAVQLTNHLNETQQCNQGWRLVSVFGNGDSQHNSPSYYTLVWETP